MAVNVPSTMMPFEPSTFSPMNYYNMPMHPMHHTMSPMHPMHHAMPMHPMHHMPMHPMHHNMPMHPMHPMHHMPSHSMNMMTPFGESMNTPFFHHEMNTPFFNHEMTPFFHHESMTPFHGMPHSMPRSMSPMTNWMRHQLPREIRDVVFRPMNVLEYNTFAHPVVYHPDGSRMLHLAFEVKGFKPEEVKIEVLAKERAIVVEAKHEVKEKEHNVTRHYLRKVVLPEDVQIDLSKVELKSVLTHDGLLVLESVLPRITPEELKAIREKAPSKTTPYMPTGPITPTGHHAISIPVKMN